MLSSITSYFFGGSEVEEATPVNVEVVQTQEEVEKAAAGEVRLKETAAEDEDWTIVETASSRSSSVSGHCQGCHSNTVYTDTTSASNSSSQYGPQVFASGDTDRDTDASDLSSLPEPLVNPSLEEPWLVTPPPIFTAGGASPQQLADHPMENLLIEHPSMSVYGPRTRQGSTGTDSNSSDSPLPTTNNKSSRMLRHPPRRPGALAARAGMVSQVQCIKSMQVVQRRKDSQKLSRSSISRSNKVADNLSRNRHARRKHYMLNPSGRSNNRQNYSQ